LSFLDAEPIARKLALMPLPIVTGIGHAANSGLLDAVAWRATETPTAAAQLVRRLKAAEAAERAATRLTTGKVPSAVLTKAAPMERVEDAAGIFEDAANTETPSSFLPASESANVSPDSAEEHSPEAGSPENQDGEFPEDGSYARGNEIRGGSLPLEALPGLKDGVWPMVVGRHGLVFEADQALQEVGLTLIFRDGSIGVKVLLPHRTRRH
jgi:hypothetical protein